MRGKIVISGYYGFLNAGDEAMLTAILKALTKSISIDDIVVISGNPQFTSSKHNVKSIHRFDFLKIIKAIFSSDLLLSGGGSLLQDVTSKKSLFYYLSILFIAKCLNKKTMLYAQGIGPIKSNVCRLATSYICKRVDLVTVRDDGSYEELQELGVAKDKIIVTADAVFSLEKVSENIAEDIFEKYNIKKDVPLIGISVRKWNNSQSFIKEFAKAVVKLRDTYNAQIVFIPMQLPADVLIAEKILELIDDKKDIFVLNNNFTTKEYLSIIGKMKIVIAMRLHALVFAALVGVPFLAISYDPKIDRFMKSFDGVIISDVENLTSEKIIETVRLHLKNNLEEQDSKIALLREEALENARRAIDIAAK